MRREEEKGEEEEEEESWGRKESNMGEGGRGRMGGKLGHLSTQYI